MSPCSPEIVDEGRATPPTAGAAPSGSSAKAEIVELEQTAAAGASDAHLQRALASLSVQLKADLEAVIRDTVARAVAAEIARLRGPSRGS